MKPWAPDGCAKRAGVLSTIKPGTLIVASAYPDPPFDVVGDGTRTGFDVELMRGISARLGLKLEPLRYSGDDFNGIFSGLNDGSYDAVISGTTITPDRQRIALFSQPYLEFGQGIAVNTRIARNVRSTEDLRGLVAGIQRGNTSDAVARDLLDRNIISRIAYYPYDRIQQALADLDSDKIGLVIKLFPVISELVKDHPDLAVPLEVPTHEQLGIAFAKNDRALCDAVNSALDALKADGSFSILQRRWIPSV
jgi:polar amino acid transport system substrate-binding protein